MRPCFTNTGAFRAPSPHPGRSPQDVYLSCENLYFIHPEVSHVSKDFAMQDSQFWIVKEGR